MNHLQLAAALPATAVLAIENVPFPRIATGKVRENFDLGDALLIAATDRLSAFDVVMREGIPGKGAILTQMSGWWFARTAGIIRNHLLPDQAAQFDKFGLGDPGLRLRSMIVRKLKPLPLECIVRGYLAGSGWESYRRNGEVCGHKLPPGLRQAGRLPRPLFTPTTKAPKGQHDEAINDRQAAALVGDALYERIRAASLALYEHGRDRAEKAGIILADTKFEFGLDPAGELVLMDEILTPDSSRYWPLDGYAEGCSPPSYDKQFVRDHLLAIKWDQKPPAPALPEAVIEGTRQKYLAAYKALVG